MPAPVSPWVTETFLTAKSLNIALYTCDGTSDNPNGVAFSAYRPVLFENGTLSATLHTSAAGSQSALSTSGSITAAAVVYDTAGYYGQYSDQPGNGYYEFLAAVKGSAGDGVTAGGWHLLSHFAAITRKTTQTSVSADLLGTGHAPVSGTRQAPSASSDSTAFFLDLVNAAGGPNGITWQPAVTIADSASTSTTSVVSGDGSGETCRFTAIWAAVSATVQGQAIFDIAGTYPFTAPAGVTSITVNATGSGAGGGAGNSSGGGVEYGGGGAGGGENAQGSVGVTGGNNYTVIVGAGGAGGVTGAASGNGGAGNLSQFTGDSAVSVTGHGGSHGNGATTSANGTGGSGGTGSGGTHFNGGGGATGATGQSGGGGGSSAGTGQAGATATGPAAAPAPPGGGPGGTGGEATISVVQSLHDHGTGNNFTTSFQNAVQAGNTVIVAVIYQGDGASTDPTVTLNDGTPLQSAATADQTSLLCAMQTGLYDTTGLSGGVSGGQTGLKITGHGGSGAAFAVQAYEVAGLGPSPQLDVSASAVHQSGAANVYPPPGGTSPVSTKAPEIWFGIAGGQQTSNFSINPPASSQGWSCLPQSTASAHSSRAASTVYSGILTGYQVKAATGTIKYSGTYSKNLTGSWITAGYSTSAATAGTAPVTGPGGGGGGGLGAGSNGGNGADGQVILTWTGISGSGYVGENGLPPALPSPFAAWSPSTTVGAGSSSFVSAANVDINGVSGITSVLNYLASPPVFRVSATTAQSIPTAALTQVTFSGATPTVDSYSGWNTGTGTYTVQRAGLYLFHGLVCFANGTGQRQAAVTVNSTSLWGPPAAPITTGTANVPKTQILYLQAGDTVQLACYQNSGGNLALATTDQTRFLLVWLCETGTPAASWTPPDTTFRYTSGTDGAVLPAGFQSRLANDLGFLVNRPYLLVHQASAQSSLTVGAFSTVTMDTVAPVIHAGGVADNYSGWAAGASNAYTAQVPGWYLAVMEVTATSDATAGATVTAGLLASTSGGVTPAATPDWHQQAVTTSASALGGGATAYGLYYLSTGESLTPQIRASSYAAPYGTLTGTSRGASRNSHLEMVWISS